MATRGFTLSRSLFEWISSRFSLPKLQWQSGMGGPIRLQSAIIRDAKCATQYVNNSCKGNEMNRRAFLGAACVGVAACAVGAESLQLKYQLVKGEFQTVELTGSRMARKRFHDIWQTKLWPDWKASDYPEAVRQRDLVSTQLNVSNVLVLWVGGKQHLDALRFAIQNCGMSISESIA